MRTTAPIAGLFFALFVAIHSSRASDSDAVQVSPVRAIGAAISRIKPALIRIHVVTADHIDGREAKYESAGSGIIITAQGHAVTNHHVAGRAKRIVCTLSDRREVSAVLVGTDPLTDIAVIKLDGGEKNTPFTFATFGNSDSLRVGDVVLAMGSPLSLSQSVTMGIVSNAELTMPELYWPFDKMTIDGEDVGSLVRWIGHDAVIFPGNSGGPLVNERGEIVGINEISLGIGGAIPGNLAKTVAHRIIAERAVGRSWIGLGVQPLLKGSGQQQGALVSGAVEGSPAHKAGFRPGDILLSINQRGIVVRFPEELPHLNQIITELPSGKLAVARILRDGKELTLRFTPTKRDYFRPETVEMKGWGLTARNISMLAAKELQRESRNGVLVTSIRPGGPSGEARPPLAAMDIIVAVDGISVRSLKDLVAATDKLAKREDDEPTPVLVTFERAREQLLTVIKIGLNEHRDKALEVRKAWLPVSMQVLSPDIAQRLGIPGRTGMRITRVYPGSSAQKAGLTTGDIITALDGEPVTASAPEDFEDLAARIRRYKIGSTAVLKVLGNKREREVKVRLEASPPSPREMQDYRDQNFEFTVRDIAFADRQRTGVPKQATGVWVEVVDQAGWAALGKLAVGDVIVSVNGRKIESVREIEEAMESVAQKRERSVVFEVLRGIHTLFLELEPDWK